MKNHRRGITLLFVVSMIVLFLLMGTAFVVVAGDFLRGAKKRARIDLYQVDADALLERAFYDLVREPLLDDASSPLRGHSLLGDMYGYGFSVNVSAASVHASQQFLTLKLDFQNSGQAIIDGSPYQPETGLSLGGLVLCFTSGPAQGLATRIVDHQVSGSGTSAQHTVIVQPDWGDSEFDVSRINETVGARVVVNGRPFAGTGAGNFDALQPLNRPALSDSALQPNQSGRTKAELTGRTGDGYLSRSVTTGTGQIPNSESTNEPYDTFDFQNMFLAGINPDGTVLAPSFHRQYLIDAYPLQPETRDFRAIKTGGPNNDGIVVDNDNSGSVDGVWIDIGLPTQTGASGTHFKPLVSYTVVDLDGRINVNAHGNQYEGGQQMTELLLVGNPTSALHRGVGYGPPEISMNNVLGTSASNMFARYGIDGLPGEKDVRDGWSAYKLFEYPNAPLAPESPDILEGTVGGVFGTAMDIHGRFAVGTPNRFHEFNDPKFPLALPGVNVSTSTLETELVDSAYEMSFAGRSMAGPDDRGFDDPFSPHDLEGVFRRNDPDSRLLAKRLLNAGSGVFESGINSAANSVTTDSFEVPTNVEPLSLKLARLLSSNGVTENRIREQLKILLPSEVLRGLPMNVNRPFGDGIDNNNNQLVDEIGELNTVTHPGGSDYTFDNTPLRTNFARHLFVLTLLCTEQVDRNGDGSITAADWFDFNNDGNTDDQDRDDFRKMVAQWAINVVDFRDRDSVMSAFEVDLNPWDGWDVDGNPQRSASEAKMGALRQVLWGAERPELLITETFASHDRRTQDLKIDSSGKFLRDNDEDLDSHLVPAVAVFFELYNPWFVHDISQSRPPELSDPDLHGIDLQKTTSNGAPVWRLVVTETDKADVDPDEVENSARRIYFTKPSTDLDDGPEVYFPDEKIVAASIQQGVYAVVGSAGVVDGKNYTTYFGRLAAADPKNANVLTVDQLNRTRRIVMNPSDQTLDVWIWNTELAKVVKMEARHREVISIPVGRSSRAPNGRRNLGISDPVDGYTGLTENGMTVNQTSVEDGEKFTIDMPDPETDFAFDEPVDRKQDQKHYDKYLKNDGLIPAYRTVHLQRLANPIQPFHATTNPYRTIDSSSIDLRVFNGVDATADPNNVPLDKLRFGTFERRSGLDENGDPASDGQDKTNHRHRLLFRNNRQGHQHPNQAESKPIDDQNDAHFFKYNLVESLGGFNKAYQSEEDDKDPSTPFAWLCWNNRPFASQLELANVPFTSSYWLTRLFNVGDPDRNVYTPPAEEQPSTEARSYTAQFPYLLNFYADKLENGDPAPGLHRLFDYLEVPSRFVGTESYINPEIFKTDQGLSFSMAAPFDTISNYRYPGKLNINTITDARVWNGLMLSYASDAAAPLTFNDWKKSRDGEGALGVTRFQFANPYRSPLAANWVPTSSLVANPAECGLFRSDGNGQPLFDYSPATKAKYNDDDRGAYFKYDRRQRLGNLVTGRSSVFAIWITVGYFEVDAAGGLVNVNNGGMEVGSQTGEVQRNRAFYLFDRSIPVAFEPGKNHNVDRAVLVRSRIE